LYKKAEDTFIIFFIVASWGDKRTCAIYSSMENIYSFQKKGGISRIFTEVPALLCRLSGGVAYHPVLSPGLSGKACRSMNKLPVCLRVTGLRNFLWLRAWRGDAQQVAANCLFEFFRYTRSLQYGIRLIISCPGKWQGPVVILVADIIHELYPELLSGRANDRFRKRKRRCIEEADQAICISQTTRLDVIKYYGITPKKIAVAHLARAAIFVFWEQGKDHG